MREKTFFTFIAVVILLLFNSVDLFAIDYGKIKGRATDKATGQPVLGASVKLVGTKQGAMSNMDGEYIIEHIKPGEYKLKTSTVSYKTVEIPNIIVFEDSVTFVDISLDSLPRDTTVNDTSEGEILIRGGRTGEVVYIIDSIYRSPVLVGAGPIMTLGSRPTRGAIFGRVIDKKTCKPISNAKISIENKAFYRLTDSFGYYNFINLDEGKYKLSVEADGYLITKDKSVNVKFDKISRLDFKMKPVK